MNAQLLSVCTTAQQVRDGVVRAEALARAALTRADAYDQVQPQAWITRCPAAAVLAAAQAVDARLAAGEVLPLAGVCFAVKDNIDVAGLPTTAACPEFAYTPTVSAQVVTLLQQAGAILLGKANLDQFATGLSGGRSPYGVPHCVFNPDYISGGSSSGSGVLVAAGVVQFALGTDTAGSGRVPAMIQGLIGWKPTRGRWSNRGVVPACRSVDCVTVFAPTLDDAQAVDSVLAQPDAADPWSRPVPPAAPAGVPRRVGVARPMQLDFNGDGESRGLYLQALDDLQRAGAELVEVDIQPLLDVARLLYGGPWVAERLEVTESLLASRPGAFHPVVRGILQEARLISAADTFRAIHQVQAAQRAAAGLWTAIDTLCLPTAPTVFRVADMLADPVTLNSALGRYTNFVNLLDFSAIAIPAGFRANHTGFGITLIGPAWAEPALAALAGQFLAQRAHVRPAVALAANPRMIELAVVGAHLREQPLNWQLSSRRAAFVSRTTTAPVYALYAMLDQQPVKPALVHVGADTGRSVEVEVYRLEEAAFGSFVAEVPPPLAIGTVELADGRRVKGFVAEPRALAGAQDITSSGGWRAWLASRSA